MRVCRKDFTRYFESLSRKNNLYAREGFHVPHLGAHPGDASEAMVLLYGSEFRQRAGILAARECGRPEIMSLVLEAKLK
jgi:hypothetical protein